MLTYVPRSGSSEQSAEAMRTNAGEPVAGGALVAKLIDTFGVQIFTLGKFHSDPHPGNLLVAPDGQTLSIIDFGQTKVGTDPLPSWAPAPLGPCPPAPLPPFPAPI